MLRLINWKLLFAIVFIWTLGTLGTLTIPAWAAPRTCREHQEICFDYCGRNIICRDECKTAHENCLAKGCWENGGRKECGFERK